MSTRSQIEANRLNSQKSTGPRTAEGKAASSRNALKSGLDSECQFIIGEEREDFYALQQEHTALFQPLTAAERFQVDNLIRNEWLLRRLFRVESDLWEYQTAQANRHEGMQLGEAFSKSSTIFMRLHRRVTHCERAYEKAFTELHRLQAGRQPAPQPDAEPDPPPQPQETATETAHLASFRNSTPAAPSPAESAPSPDLAPVDILPSPPANAA
jgi:hypothetical protein